MFRLKSRRSFIASAGAGALFSSVSARAQDRPPVIPGFEKSPAAADASKDWRPVSDRRIRVGIAGYGVCKFGAAFSFQDHPNVEVVAVTDLFPDRCAELAKVCRCRKTYPSIEEMLQEDRIEAVFVATDAPSHADHCIQTLRKGKHVASAVPAVFGSLEDADRLWQAVKESGKKYMMFETSCFHQDLYAMRALYRAGHLGRIVYAEGEYYHYMEQPIPSFRDWRVGLPPQYYPTHSNAYYIGIHGGSFTEVSCMAMPSRIEHLKSENNRYRNSYGTETALFRTSEGGSARMCVSWDTPGHEGEMGRIRAQKGAVVGGFQGLDKNLPEMRKPSTLPPGVEPGGHGGSHGYLTHEFVNAILEDRTPLVNIAWALNMTVAGIVAHQSAVKGGELMKIPQYSL